MEYGEPDSRQGAGVQDLEWKAWRSMRRRERKVDNRRVSIAGEQFFCGGRAVSYQRAEEAEREKNSILFDKVATFPVYFQFVSNRGGGELHF